MSDFGVVIIIEKENGAISEGEKTVINRNLTDIIFSGRKYTDFKKSGNFKNLYEWDEQSVCSKLAEYEMDEYADEIKEIVEDEELPLAEDIADELQKRLGEHFRVTASVEDW